MTIQTGEVKWVQQECGCVEVFAGTPGRVIWKAWCDEHVPAEAYTTEEALDAAKKLEPESKPE